MIEKIILNHLTKSLNVPVLMEERVGLPSAYVIIEKVGGGESNHISRATVAVQSYGKSLHDAAELNEKVKEAMGRIAELDDVSRCELNSDYNYTNTTKKKYRYQAVFDLVYF